MLVTLEHPSGRHLQRFLDSSKSWTRSHRHGSSSGSARDSKQ